MKTHIKPFRIRPVVQAAARWLPLLESGLWALALVSLPLTSFPPFRELTGAIVAPFAALPVFVLLGLAVFPRLLRGGSLPREVTPFLVFILVAVAASAAAFFIPFPSFKDRSPLDQELRAFVTLAVGAAFYLAFAAFPADDARLRRTLQWIHIGALFLFAWAAVQVYYNARGLNLPDTLQGFSDFLSLKTPYFRLRNQRVTGFAYEPSWFGHQMVMLYLPLLLAAVYTRVSAFRRRVIWFSVEHILLLPALTLFFLSSPRISLLALMLSFFYIFWLVNMKVYRSTLARLAGWLRPGRKRAAIIVVLGLLLAAMLVALYAAAFGGVFYTASLRDWRMQALLTAPPTVSEIRSALQMNEVSLLNMANRFAFLERMSYWLSGWSVFNRYPWLGVGLGNSGFFAFTDLPAMSWGSFEIRDYLFRSASLPNIKSFWVRLLAETGLAGFSVFLAFLAVCWRSASITLRSALPVTRLTAFAGQLMILAFISEGFSIDSFAMPYLWVGLGLIAASGRIERRRLVSERQAALTEPIKN